MLILDNLWIIPLLPLLGSATNGLFGKKFTNKIVNAVAVHGQAAARIACGSVVVNAAVCPPTPL